MALRVFGRSVVGGFFRHPVKSSIRIPMRTLVVPAFVGFQPETSAKPFSSYENPFNFDTLYNPDNSFNLDTSYDPKKIRTNFLDYVIRSLYMRYPAQEVKKILDNPNVQMFDLVQVPDSYQTLITCSHVFDTQPNDPHLRDAGAHRSGYGSIPPTDFTKRDIDELLELLLTHPKASIHMVDAICSGIADTYEAQSRREDILNNIFNDPHIGKFVIEKAGEFIYHAAVYSRHPTFTIRTILERYESHHKNVKNTEDSGLCSLCKTDEVNDVVNIQTMNIMMAHQHALNIGDGDTQNLLESHPISANILE